MLKVQNGMKQHAVNLSLKRLLSHLLQRDPAEEALKSNNMNLDQAMSKFPSVFSSVTYPLSVIMLPFH